MTAKQINERIIKWLAPWDLETDADGNDTETINHIQTLLDNGLEELYNNMINDIGVMAENDDDETRILYELVTADNNIIQTYKELYL